jgi:fatty acid-binding protein DegV
MADIVAEKIPTTTPIRVQLIHGNNLEGIAMIRDRISELFDCTFDDVIPVAPLLGAHTGPSVVGIAAAPLHIFKNCGLNILKTENTTV